mmetsp:Transcript_49884/g.134194  ORF Transcript_49884/g.134194 Transcript_49884/m.134194 type:complete len:307 (+) Transcript_49884:3-923(+)
MRPTIVTLSICLAFSFSVSTALSPSSYTARSLEHLERIPKQIWVTGQWNSDSAEVNDQIADNIGYRPLEKRSDTARGQAEAHFAKWVPVGSCIRYFTDDDMDESVRNVSDILAGKGIMHVEDAYFNLRPGAFRADVWRLLQLWVEGGVYLDANINLTRKVNDWIDFSRDQVVIVRDGGVPNGFWNAMMAAEPHNPYIENAIVAIVGHIREHYYGANPLEITGPIALAYSFKSQPAFPRGIRRDLQWKDGKVTNRDGLIMATKDDVLHDTDPSKHYGPMWHSGQVYCDQKGPEPDRGKCRNSVIVTG